MSARPSKRTTGYYCRIIFFLRNRQSIVRHFLVRCTVRFCSAAKQHILTIMIFTISEPVEHARAGRKRKSQYVVLFFPNPTIIMYLPSTLSLEWLRHENVRRCFYTNCTYYCYYYIYFKEIRKAGSCRGTTWFDVVPQNYEM